MYPCDDLKQENPSWTRKDRSKEMVKRDRKEECLDCEIYKSCFPAKNGRLNRMSGKAHKLGLTVGRH